MRIIRYLLLLILCVISFTGYSQTLENIYSLQEEGCVKTKSRCWALQQRYQHTLARILSVSMTGKSD